MARYIDADKLEFRLLVAQRFNYLTKSDIDNAPTEDVAPVVHARWIHDGHHIRCSACNEYMCIQDREGDDIPQNYCPNCGAKMDEDEEK